MPQHTGASGAGAPSDGNRLPRDGRSRQRGGSRPSRGGRSRQWESRNLLNNGHLPESTGAIHLRDANGRPMDNYDDIPHSTRYSSERTQPWMDLPFMLPCTGPCINCLKGFSINMDDTEERLPVMRVKCRRFDGGVGSFYKLFVYTGEAPIPLVCGLYLFIDGNLNPYQIYHEHASKHPAARPDCKKYETVALLKPKMIRDLQGFARHVVPPIVNGRYGGMYDPNYSSRQWVDRVVRLAAEAGILQPFPDEEEERRLRLEDWLAAIVQLMTSRAY